MLHVNSDYITQDKANGELQWLTTPCLFKVNNKTQPVLYFNDRVICKDLLEKSMDKMSLHFQQYSTVESYAQITVFAIVIFVLQAKCAVVSEENYMDDIRISTESPDIVESFNPEEWIPKNAENLQITINAMKLETKVRLRYARTRIIVDVTNPHDKPLQANFHINLPEDAFFTIFKLKRGKEPQRYTASVMRKEDAWKVYHYAHVTTNGSITAGVIETSNGNARNSYNLKLTLAPGIRIEGFLVYETLIQRKSDRYTQKIHVFPLEVSAVKQLEYFVDVEELEGIKSLHCSNKSKDLFPNSIINQKWDKHAELIWRDKNVSTRFVRDTPFEFEYELDQQNASSAVVFAQRNGNLYFLHLFVPEGLPPIPKHIVFLLDVSDSMHGKKLDQLRWAMTEILDDLAPTDFFSIVTFSSEASVWSKFSGDRRKCPLPFPATEEYKESARYFLTRTMTAHGATNIYLGMTKAFALIQLFSPETTQRCDQESEIRSPLKLREKVKPKLPENVGSIIFFLSDGSATSGERDHYVLLSTFYRINRQKLVNPVPIYTIAFGDNANVDFLKALALENGGITKVIPENSVANIEVANFYAEISFPVLSHIHTNFSSNQSSCKTISKSQMHFSALSVSTGSEILTTGELHSNGSIGNGNGTDVSCSLINFEASTEAIGSNGRLVEMSPVYDCRSLENTWDYCLNKIDLFLERLQAYQKLKRLMERDKQVEQGYLCPKAFDDVYSEDMYSYDDYEYEESQDHSCANPYKEQIIDLGIKLGFVTPYTSFILCSAPNVDVGLTGKIKKFISPDGIYCDVLFNSSLQKTPLPQKSISATQLDHKVQIEAEESIDETPALSYKSVNPGNHIDISPPISQNIKISDLASTSVSNDNITRKPHSDKNNQPNWFTKALQDFAKLLIKKLFIGKERKNSSTNIGGNKNNTLERFNNNTLEELITLRLVNEIMP